MCQTELPWLGQMKLLTLCDNFTSKSLPCLCYGFRLAQRSICVMRATMWRTCFLQWPLLRKTGCSTALNVGLSFQNQSGSKSSTGVTVRGMTGWYQALYMFDVRSTSRMYAHTVHVHSSENQGNSLKMHQMFYMGENKSWIILYFSALS